MSQSTHQKIIQLVSEIRSLKPEIESTIESLKEKKGAFNSTCLEGQGNEYWQIQFFTDSLIRIRIFIENNFNYIETLGILSLCRYVLELSIWLKHIIKDERYAYVYARKLIIQQIEHYEALARHLQREINLYRELACEESAAHSQILKGTREAEPFSAAAMQGRQLAQDIQFASEQIDQKLALQFATHSDGVRQNGYSFHAYALETKVLPQIIEFIRSNKQSLATFDNNYYAAINQLKIKGWNWKIRAEYVGMETEYDFIYSYTSRLMHAMPASLTTNQKSLEDEEIYIFLRYIRTEFQQIMDTVLNKIQQKSLH